MTLFPLLPFCRQSLSARRKLLEELRGLLKSVRQAQEDVPRFRLRSLDVIPLAFSLSRYASLHSITHHIDPQASMDVWSCLQLGSHFTTNLLNTLCKFYAASGSATIPRFPPLMTWNPSSLKAIHSQPSPKLTHILQLARTHICHLQETQWTSLQYNHLHQQALFVLSSMPLALTTILVELLPLSLILLFPLLTPLLFLVLFFPSSLLSLGFTVNLLTSTFTPTSSFCWDRSSLNTYKVLRVVKIPSVLLVVTLINFNPSLPLYSIASSMNLTAPLLLISPRFDASMVIPVLWISFSLRCLPIPLTTTPLSLFHFGLPTSLQGTASTFAGSALPPT